MPAVRAQALNPDSSDFPVLSLAKDVGAVSGETLVDAFVFAIGVVRDPAVSYLTKGGSEPRRSLFWAKYKTMQIAVMFIQLILRCLAEVAFR